MNKPQKELLTEALQHLEEVPINVNVNDLDKTLNKLEHFIKAKTILKCLKDLDGQLD